jgi:hypothetical protein
MGTIRNGIVVPVSDTKPHLTLHAHP